MAYKHQSTASPLKRIRTARGLTMMEVAVLSDVGYNTIRRIDRMRPDQCISIRLEALMRVALTLECSVVDLMPILGVTAKHRKPLKQKIGRAQDYFPPEPEETTP